MELYKEDALLSEGGGAEMPIGCRERGFGKMKKKRDLIGKRMKSGKERRKEKMVVIDSREKEVWT